MGYGVGRKVQVPWGRHGYPQGLQDREHVRTTVLAVRQLLSLQELSLSVPHSPSTHISPGLWGLGSSWASGGVRDGSVS